MSDVSNGGLLLPRSIVEGLLATGGKFVLLFGAPGAPTALLGSGLMAALFGAERKLHERLKSRAGQMIEDFFAIRRQILNSSLTICLSGVRVYSGNGFDEAGSATP